MLLLMQGRMQENFAIWSVVRGQLSVAADRRQMTSGQFERFKLLERFQRFERIRRSRMIEPARLA